MKRLGYLVLLMLLAIAFVPADSAHAQDNPGVSDPFYQEPPGDIDTTYNARVDYCIARGHHRQVCYDCRQGLNRETGQPEGAMRCQGVEVDARCMCTTKSSGGCKDMNGYCDWRYY